jgi:hypothetical protein
MALVFTDKTQDTTTSTGSGPFVLSGTAPAGYQNFSGIGDSNTTYYEINDASGNWMVVTGVYTSAGTSLSVVTVQSSSAGGTTPVSFGAGSKTVFCTYPAGKAVLLDTSNALTLATPLAVSSGGTGAATLAGANIPVTNAANTFTATQTFNGTSSTLGTVLLDSAETVNIVAAAPASTTNLYVQSGSVQYYTSNAANNFIVNLAFSSGTSMNTAMTTGQSVTAALITTQNTTAYYNTAVQVDGTGTGVTTRWIGGAPIAGNASGLDTYRFAVIKTGSATYTVLASLTQYKA